jgi:hypothetical protein
MKKYTRSEFKNSKKKKIEKSDYLNNHPTNYQEILHPKS